MEITTLTTLDAALVGMTALGFDIASLIYFIERHPDYGVLMREVFRRVDTGTIAGYTSTITVTEILTKPYQVQDDVLAHRYRTLLLRSRNFTVVPIDAVIADRAAEIRARYRLRTPDALQLATAIQAGCEAFLTNDHALRRVVDIRVLILDELEQ
ncbi:MAG: type II toxin-antitoxin system VapC family toxin [Thermomicrobiales bacterium]